MSEQNIALKIDYFYNDDDIDLRVESKKEMHFILQNVANQGNHVALYYGNHHVFILTILLGADDQGLWLDISSSSAENKQILRSEKITFVSSHRNVKIQFESTNIKSDTYEGHEAFYMEYPDYLLRIQRREFYRVHIPVSIHIKCMIPIQPDSPEEPIIKREIPLVDISGNGIGLLCDENEADLIPEKIFSGCQISIPEYGILTFTIEVKTSINITTRSDVIKKRVGCHFVELDNKMNILLQRYITFLQRENLAYT